MADTEEKTNKENDQKSQTKIGILTWIIMAVIVAVCAGSGFFLARVAAGSLLSPPNISVQQNTTTEKADTQIKNDSNNDPKDIWYYNDLASIVVNPNEPRATRFVRVGLILELSSKVSEGDATTLIQAKEPLLINWINLYFKGLTLDEMENDKDIQRILSHTCDAFNEILFPDTRSHIKRVLIREFNIQ